MATLTIATPLWDLRGKGFTHRTDDLYDLHDLYDLYGLYGLYDLYDLYDLTHAAGWELYNLHDPGHISWVGSVLYR